MERYNVLVAVNEPGLAATVRFDSLRAESAEEAADVARLQARNQFGGHAWQVERVEVQA